ncbi:thioredoxin-like fold domain-containing protein MRL7L, chloroplastic isoform X1 [Pistacia vera]|uniref:thioredoxin-like fold domain-containing protein MRL7L, chloroplastic isoform X1 n=2 Tax=Pistacia vera TaxID=55513 RepID=UPI00126367FF|nr:thioredoxin-like fold domain-containing protein MRL7L, chloroplastic isoform X1 [Pistacia vera]
MIGQCSEMALQYKTSFLCLYPPLMENRLKNSPSFAGKIQCQSDTRDSSPKMECTGLISNSLKLSPRVCCFSPIHGQTGSFRRSTAVRSLVEKLGRKGGGESSDADDDDDSSMTNNVDDGPFMDPEERLEWRRKIREVIDRCPDVKEEIDPIEKKKKLKKLLADYPLVVEEDDPDWPEDADGWGFSLGQFFDKITIKNVKKDDDDENYDSENEIVWQDDNYIRPIKDIKTVEWEEIVFKDISPLIVLVHNRYKRPKENKKIRDEIEKAVHIIWNCRLPSPRCVAVDANVEHELVSALQVSIFPEVIFTKAGKILYREKAIRTADELSKMMAFFYYGAAKPACLNGVESTQEMIPSVIINNPT